MTIMTIALAMAVAMMIAAIQTMLDEHRREMYRNLRAAANRGRFAETD
jgi:hypothetical protein